MMEPIWSFFLVPCCECQFLFTIHHATCLRFIKAGNYAQLADKSFSRISFNNKCGERKKSRSVTGIICLTTSFSLRIYLRLEVPDGKWRKTKDRKILKRKNEFINCWQRETENDSQKQKMIKKKQKMGSNSQKYLLTHSHISFTAALSSQETK